MPQAIVKHHQVRTPAGVAFPHGSRSASGSERPRAEATAELLRIEGVVRALQVRCSCGETVVVQLEYPKSTPQP